MVAPNPERKPNFCPVAKVRLMTRTLTGRQLRIQEQFPLLEKDHPFAWLYVSLPLRFRISYFNGVMGSFLLFQSETGHHAPYALEDTAGAGKKASHFSTCSGKDGNQQEGGKGQQAYLQKRGETDLYPGQDGHMGAIAPPAPEQGELFQDDRAQHAHRKGNGRLLPIQCSYPSRVP